MCESTPNASQVAEQNSGDSDIDDPVQGCPLTQCTNLISIGWLDGDEATTIENKIQYVNLPREIKWVDGVDVLNIDQLGNQPRLLVKFDGPDATRFTYQIVEAGIESGTQAYTDGEKGRHVGFRITDTEPALEAQAVSGEATINSLILVQGGGYKFKVRATDEHGTTKETGILTTKRLLWMQEMTMQTVASGVAAEGTVTELEKYGLKVNALPNIEIPLMNNVDPDNNTDWSRLLRNMNSAVSSTPAATAKQPYLIAIANVKFCESHEAKPFRKRRQSVGPRRPNIEMPLNATSPGGGVVQHFLYDVDRDINWYIFAQFRPGRGRSNITIPKNKLTISADRRLISIDVTGLPRGRGTVAIRVRVSSGGAAGLSAGRGSQTTVTTENIWGAQPATEQIATAIHEIGHQLRMSPNGSNAAETANERDGPHYDATHPDAGPHYYNGRGHVGPHCHHGIPAGQAKYDTGADENLADCVMYGGTASTTTYAFCDQCGPRLCKVDLSTGF